MLAHFLTVIGEWAATVGVLVYAYDWGGSSAVGLVSLAVLAPPLVCAPLAAALTARHRAHRVRLAGFAVQTVAYTGAAIAVSAGSPAPIAAGFVVVGLGGINTLRPTGAVLMPAVVRTTKELISGNLWVAACDSSSALLGPLAAAGLAALAGSSAVFTGCAVGAAIAFVATAHRPAPLALARTADLDGPKPRRVMRVAAEELRQRPWSIGVLAIASARNIVVGAFDVLLVIIALRTLDLGDQGPGLLSALVGTGALLSALVATFVVRRARLRPALVTALVATALMCAALGLRTDVPVVMVLLPLLGICLSLMDNLSRMLLQRSTDPRSLGPLFAVLGLVSGGAQLAGSLLAQGLFAVGGVETALLGVGAVLALLAVGGFRSLRRADAHAEVPVVEMTLLMGLPMFAPLPAVTLEAVARAAERITVADGETVITQGEYGDTFFAVSEGEFDVEMNGTFIRTARRGDFFGEVVMLADVPRTGTVRSRGDGVLLGIHRDPFLVAVTGHDRSHAVALEHVDRLDLGEEVNRQVRERRRPIAPQVSADGHARRADDHPDGSEPAAH